MKKPKCPFCEKEMIVVEYIGYYDVFCYWECDCDSDDLEKHKVRKWRGGYA